jgi:hypothetical protein
LVLSDDVGRDGQPAPPPDPEWQADLVLPDEPPCSRPAKPADPSWKPDVVLHDAEDPARFRADESARAGAEPRPTPDLHSSLFQHISARPRRDSDESWLITFSRVVGILLVLVLFAATIWLVYLAWTFDPESVAKGPAVIL